ncbi:MAG: glycoside hydrolase family 3 C-terminal domain-containing protein [Oscillospiraceae bacterium]|nr:glycoside hydrolase family 3 C-terminal domain-containing protein [Oscillospiraceae bacterium]
MSKKILDWDKYIEKSAETISEGIVMLKNDNGALPLRADEEVAVFGRIQLHYYKSGTGSGGLVNVSRVIGVTDGLIEKGVRVNNELLDIYKKWDEENPFDIGAGWGNEPWSQKEMPVEDSLAARIAEKCSAAIVIIGRTAGEEQDNKNIKGAYLLSDGEEQMLAAVRKNFKRVIVLLNVGNIIDMSFVEKYSPDAVLYIWQGGMVGGLGTADVLTGKVSPSGKLPDTIARSVSDHPSDKYFGDNNRNFYAEDIYVGYRYFETFAPEKVLYPFGFGLSYTKFEIKPLSSRITEDKAELTVAVKNMGDRSGKEVVQLYCSAPQGMLGKPAKILCGYEKTRLLTPSESQEITFKINFSELASYDDSGASGHRFCYVLEKGEYKLFCGTDVRSCTEFLSFDIPETKIVKQLKQAMAPVTPFKRMKPVSENVKLCVSFEDVPLSEINEPRRRLNDLPKEIPFTGDKGIKLSDVRSGKNTLEDFIAQLSDHDLSCIIRGEGMGSPKVTAGTAAAFGGVSDGLADLGIPCGCCSDGPSGMRLDCGTKAFSLPNGTLIASTFNRSLVSELFEFMGREMSANRVDCLLGPGMNIHRHPLNGRNFEYFSEDPFLTGTIAAAELKGLHSEGVTGTIKHFCGNNQETNRHYLDSAVSERALREIYLKGFEIAVSEGGADSIMTSYNSVNGLWSAGNYDLCTTILRDEWDFKGFVMTDWWANINERGMDVDKSDFAAMARAQNDVYMVCADGGNNNDNTLSSLENGSLTRAELQRNAMNICSFLLSTHAMDRLCGTADEVEIVNRPDENGSDGSDNVTFYKIDGSLVIDGKDICTDRGCDFIFALDVADLGLYRFTLTGSSELSELAQIPVTVFSMGTPFVTFTWNGTGGLPVSFDGTTNCFSRFTTIRVYFAQSGLKLHSIKIEKAD